MAIFASSLLFALFHQEYYPGVVVYRTIAGMVLGCLFWARGFSVCVYTHALYDVYYYLSHLSSP